MQIKVLRDFDSSTDPANLYDPPTFNWSHFGMAPMKKQYLILKNSPGLLYTKNKPKFLPSKLYSFIFATRVNILKLLSKIPAILPTHVILIHNLERSNFKPIKQSLYIFSDFHSLFPVAFFKEKLLSFNHFSMCTNINLPSIISNLSQSLLPTTVMHTIITKKQLKIRKAGNSYFNLKLLR